MTVLATLAVVVLGVSSALGTLRVVLGPDDASRAVVADLLFFTTIAMFVVLAVLLPISVLFDVALLATLSGVVATLAFARMLTRGDR